MEPILNKTKGEHYNLRWNNYSSNLIQVFSEHQCEEKLVDVTLVCEGQYVKAHKLVLSACSVFFQDMFKSYGNVIHPFIILNGIKFNHLKHIMEFIYQGEIKVSDSDLEGVLTLGENLQVKGLSSVKLKEKVAEPNDIPKPTETSNLKQSVPITSSATIPVKVQENYISTDKLQVNRGKSVLKPICKTLVSNDNSSIPAMIMGNEGKDYSTNLSIDECEEPKKKRVKKVLPMKDRPFDENDKQNTSIQDSDEIYELDEEIRGNQQSLSVSASRKNDEIEEKIPRPANAFMIFANEWRKKLAVKHPGDNNKDISVRLGNLWKSLNSEARESYYATARQVQIQHQTKYPGYVYIPSQVRKKKKAAKRQDIIQEEYRENV